MKKISAIGAALLAACCTAAFAAGPFDQFKGKMKEGLYEYKMDMEIPGVPAQFSKQSHTMQHCMTGKEIENGDFAKGNDKSQCEVKDMKMSGNTASYKMVCKDMTMDTKTTFRDNGFTSDSKMTMNQGGQVMTTSHHIEGKYLGACK